MKLDLIGFLKFFAQLIGISTPPSQKAREQTEGRRTLFQQRKEILEEQRKSGEGQ